jgi:ubiquinone/menaquinone biosynthesis C-methylase UbiE
MTKPRVSTLPIALCLLALACAAGAQDNAADAAKLIEVLQLKPGGVVAEIGAGGGELTIALAKHVGASGRVYSNELGEDRVQRLRAAVQKGGVSNVEVIAGHESRANLPDGCCDAIFMRNVYHHFGDPAAMHASFSSALKPGGRIAVIDFRPNKAAAIATPGKRGEDGSHGVSAEVVAQERKAAGFDIVISEESGERSILVVGAKPGR